MEYQDIQLKCVTCGREFIFTAKEQEFFQSKGFREPRHCRECRQRRKLERERLYAEASGQPYQPGRELFTVTCAQCGRETEVPFKPITGKPVLCKDCFIAQRYGSKPTETPKATESQTEPPSPVEPPRPSAEQVAIPDGAPEIDLKTVTEPEEATVKPPEETPEEQAARPSEKVIEEEPTIPVPSTAPDSTADQTDTETEEPAQEAPPKIAKSDETEPQAPAEETRSPENGAEESGKAKTKPSDTAGDETSGEDEEPTENKK
jgi:CxxC-x17-CxxC domain-containing protein